MLDWQDDLKIREIRFKGNENGIIERSDTICDISVLDHYII
jgi:hypothetical protein